MSRSRKRQRQVRRRRAVAAVVVVGLCTAIVAAVVSLGDGGRAAGSTAEPYATAPAKPRGGYARPSDLARLKLRAVFGGRISPKSVASSGTGYVTAQNMMYRHTITVYDARKLKLVKTISDAVQLSRLGFPQFRGTAHGAPVE